MNPQILRTFLIAGSVTLLHCGGIEDPGDALEIETTASGVSQCIDACNPGTFNGQRWTCRANPSLPTGNACSSGWETCVVGCNPGHFQGSLWTCDADPYLATGNACQMNWRYCDPDNCSGVNVVDWDSDGCSGPGAARDKRRFRDACVGHDHCYGTPGRSKNSCDQSFRNAMLDSCGTFDVDCRIAAEAFYVAVAAAAGPAYNAAQNAVRDATIILDHGRSYYP